MPTFVFCQVQYGNSFLYHFAEHTCIFVTSYAEFLPSRYRNDPKFSDKRVWANSADPDLTAPRDVRGPV